MNRRSLVISVLVAMLVAALASRVNRRMVPQQARREAIFDQVIADVEIDTRTFKRAVKSLQKKTAAKIVIDPGIMPAVEAEEIALSDKRVPSPQRFHDVRLGALVGRFMDQWGDSIRMSCRIEDGTIRFAVFDGAPAKERRVYDLRSLGADWVRWGELRNSWQSGQMITTNPGGGDHGMSLSANPADDLARRFFYQREVLNPRSHEFSIVACWAGILIVDAPSYQHEQFQLFLATWAQGGSPTEGGGQ